jgi:peptide/nickel transport system permease protein
VRFVVRRLGFFVVTLWAAVSLNFLIPRLMPGSPAQVLLAQHPHLNPQSLHALLTLLGGNTHQSLLGQYWGYWGHVVTFNFGISLTTAFGDPVRTMVAQRIYWTLGLVGITTVLAFVLGTLIGLLSAWKRGGWLDSFLPPIFIVTSAFPYFWMALLSIYLFSVTLGWFPSDDAYTTGLLPGFNWQYISSVAEHGVLPAFTILITAIGGWILTMRNNVVTVLAEDYVRMARAKGLKPWRIVWHYVGKNAVLPNLTGFAMSLGLVLSGAILVEDVFNYPGVGSLMLSAVTDLDYPVMQALFLLLTIAVLLSILVADIVTAILDPRTR